MTELKRGDRIKCKDAEDAVDTMRALSREGVQTDFVYKNERGEKEKRRKGEKEKRRKGDMVGSDQRRKTVTIRDIAGSVSFENVILEIKDKTGQKAARVSIQSGTAAKLLSEEILSARITRLSGVKDMSGAVIIGAETGGEGKT